MAKDSYFYALGRRKSATARVRLASGKGEMHINGQPGKTYFTESAYLEEVLLKPFSALELGPEKYTVSAKVTGGGHTAQAQAIQLGIAKALSEMNEGFKATLRRAELLGRDPRERERKKAGLKSARKKRQFTKR